MEWLLTRVVGLGWAESDEEAMRLQSAISPRVEAAIDDLLGHPTTCPARQPDERGDGTRSGPPASRSSDVASDSDITILRISEEAEEDAELLVYLEQQGLDARRPRACRPGVPVARLRDHRRAAWASSMGLRPASLIRVLLGDADPSLFHQVPEAVARLGR